MKCSKNEKIEPGPTVVSNSAFWQGLRQERSQSASVSLRCSYFARSLAVYGGFPVFVNVKCFGWLFRVVDFFLYF
jgi:hypothetical protein